VPIGTDWETTVRTMSGSMPQARKARGTIPPDRNRHRFVAMGTAKNGSNQDETEGSNARIREPAVL